jgi:hypothetical protein
MLTQRLELARPLAHAPEIPRTDDGRQAHRDCRPLRERRMSRWVSWNAPSWAVEATHPAGTRAMFPR